MGFFDKPEIISPGSDNERLAAVEHRVAQLEAQLLELHRRLAAPGSVEPEGTPAWLAEVSRLKQERRVVEAVRLYRQNTGVRLARAKEAVDAL